MGVKCEIRDFAGLKKQLNEMKKTPEKVLERCMSDAKGRGPGWIATGVTKKYNVKKSEFLSGKIGRITFKGKRIDRLQIMFSGRRLTPTHFNMKPATPPGAGKSYTIKATILKGKRVKIGGARKITKKQWQNIGRNFTNQSTRNSPKSPYMLQSTGSQGGGVSHIPFQRRSQPGEMEYVMKTISMPQMVTQGENGPMHPEVEKPFIEGLEKRLNHHLKLMQK